MHNFVTFSEKVRIVSIFGALVIYISKIARLQLLIISKIRLLGEYYGTIINNSLVG